jgi:hypothetical protein
MNLKQMVQRQQEILDKAKAEKRELTAQEQEELDSLQRSIDAAMEKSKEETEPHETEGVESVRAQERKRYAEITALCQEFDVPQKDLARYLSEGTTIDAVKTAILDGLKKDGEPVARSGIDVTNSAEDKFRSAASDAIVMRSGMDLESPADGARQMMGMSLRDLAIECLSAEGGTGLTRKSADELFNLVTRQYFNPTAAFPSILDNAINKAYVQGHKTANVTFDRWTKKGSLKDFKTSDNNYLAGPAGEFLEVPEGAELKHDTFEDKKRPTRKLKTYGRQFTLTRQAFINDDIDLVTRVPAKYAASARKTINKQVYTILVKNPAIYDGTVLFSAVHGNLINTGTGITQASMQAMIMALQGQKDEFGDACIIRPACIVVPVGMSFEIYALFNSPTINTSGNTQAVNPLYRYANQIEVVEDPTINVLCGGYGNVMPWYLMGVKDDTDFIEVDYLNGQEIPTIRRMEVPGTLGLIWDIYLDWGISAMDFRGAIKNPGIAINDPLGTS